MKFDKVTSTRILTQIALHIPKKKGKSITWIKDMVLPSHIKHGLKFVDNGDSVDVMFAGDALGVIKYDKLNQVTGVYHLTGKR